MFGAGNTARRQVSRQQDAEVVPHPVPIGGVNARDALSAMAPTDAISMDNWFPTPSYLQVRNGSQTWATGLPGAVETIMAYNGLTARKLWSWSGNNLYDVTSQGAVGAAVISAMTNSRWQHQMFNAGGGNVLLCVNGADAPRRYDGGVQGGVTSTKTLVGGAGYVNNTYTNVPLTGGTGTLAQATIIVAGTAVTSVTITQLGSGYLVGDVLSASNANLGGAGAGFTVTVETVSGWSVTTITGSGLNPINLITVTVHQQRCWYIEVNSMNVWYSATSAFQGTLTKLPLGQLFKLGGSLMQMATWTIDNVAGINDYAAFITTEGEVAVYQGYDPSATATWSLVGVFHIGRPIGRRCILKFASDVLVICADGLVPLSKALLTDREQENVNLTDKIKNAIGDDVGSFAANFGWQVIDHPMGSKLIVNVPEVANSTVHQWVMNTNTTSNAWCRFLNWNANCWERQQDSLYFGGSTKVYLADVGYSDSTTAITVDCKPAFSYFDFPQEKQFLMVRPIFRSSAAIKPTVTLNVDFEDVVNPGPFFTIGLSAPWNSSPWNITPWGGTVPIFQSKDWLGVSGIGYVASGRVSFSVSNIAVQWTATDYMFAKGGPF